MSRSFINLNHTILILLSLLLTSCERKVEPKVEPNDFYELKIDGEKQKLNEDETLKLKKYSRSICKISNRESSIMRQVTLRSKFPKHTTVK